MTKSIFALLTTALLLTACGKDEAKPEASGGGNVVVPQPGAEPKPVVKPKPVEEQLDPSKFPNVDGSIYGIWAATQDLTREDGAKVSMTYFFKSDRVGMSGLCTYPEETVQTTLVGPAEVPEVAAGEIDVESNVSAKAMGHNRECAMSLSQGKISFRLESDRLFLTSEHFAPMELVRIRGQALPR